MRYAALIVLAVCFILLACAAVFSNTSYYDRLFSFAECQQRLGHLTQVQAALITGTDWRHYYALLEGNMPCQPVGSS